MGQLHGTTTFGGQFLNEDEVPVAAKDSAQTFKESGVTVSKTGTWIVDQGLGLGTPGTIATRTADSMSAGTSDNRGLIINPNTTLSGLKYTISSMTSGVDRVEVRDTSGNTLAADDDVDGTIAVELSSGTDYRLVPAGGGYTNGWYDAQSYPVSTSDIDIIQGWNGSSRNNYAYTFSDVTAVRSETSGTATVKWDHPPDVYAWDTGLFRMTPDGETDPITVDVQANDGTGWTTVKQDVSAPVSLLDIDPDANVRYKITISRSSTSNHPILNSIYRRYKL